MAGIELATAWVSILPETSKLQSGLKDALDNASRNLKIAPMLDPKIKTSGLDTAGRKAADQFGEGFSTRAEKLGSGIGLVLGKSISSAIKLDQRALQAAGHLAGNAIKIGMLGAVGAVGTVLFKGFERIEALDTAKHQLESLSKTFQASGKAAIDVKNVMADVNKVVEGTPIALQAAFGEVPKLLAAGIKPGQDLTKVLTAMADATGFLGGDSFGQISAGFDKVISQGKLMGDQLVNEFEKLPLVSWLAKTLGTDETSVRKMVSDGKIGSQQVIDAVEANIGGFAKNAGNTISGAMANAITAASRIGANFIGALFGKDPVAASDDMVQAIKNVTDRLNDINQWVLAHRSDIQQFFEDFKKAAKNVADAIGDVVNFIRNDIPGGITTVVAAFGAWEVISGVAALTTALRTVKTLLVTEIPAAATAGAAEVGAAGAVAGTGFAAGLAGAIKGFGWAAIGLFIATEILHQIDNQIGSHLDPSHGGRGSILQPFWNRSDNGPSSWLDALNPLPHTGSASGPSGPSGPMPPGYKPQNPLDVFTGTPTPGANQPGTAFFGSSAGGVNPNFKPGGGQSFTGVPAGLTGTQGVVYNAMIQAGFPASEWPSLQNLLNGESGFRPTVRNPSSGAYGLFQFLGHENDQYGAMGAYSADPAAQSVAGLQYIKNRYGSPSAAWAFWQSQSPHWYDKGGWLRPGQTMAVNETGRPELVLSPEQIQALQDQGIDPAALLQGMDQGFNAVQGQQQGQPGQPDMSGALGGADRSQGFIPVTSGANTVPGTSMLSGFLNMGAQAINGIIDQAASAGSGAANLAAPGAGLGIGIGASIAKRGVSYGFQMAGIGADALLEQIFGLFGGPPRWIGYDYSSFIPQLTPQPVAVTTGENQQQGPQGLNPLEAGFKAAQANMAPPMPTGGQHPGTGQPPGPVAVPEPGPNPFQPADPSTAPGMGGIQGQDDWLKRLNPFGFDQGGWLEPGMVGANFTRRPEAVFTPAQVEAMTNVSPGMPNFGVTIQNVTVSDVDELKRAIDSQQKLAMMRYTGRP